MKSIVTFIIILMSSNIAMSALGEKVEKIKNTYKQDSKLKQSSLLQSSYSVNEYTSSDGVKIKEYYDSNDVVFAITWTGMIHPDLENLLGQYWTEFQQSPNKVGQRRNPVLQIKTSEIVVEKSGTMRNVHGKAYVKSLIPTGVLINDIQ